MLGQPNSKDSLNSFTCKVTTCRVFKEKHSLHVQLCAGYMKGIAE